MNGKWVVHTKGGPSRNNFEICVVREDNRQGIQSYGWFGVDKRLISHAGTAGERTGGVSPLIWDGLVELAHAEAIALNLGEGRGAVTGSA